MPVTARLTSGRRASGSCTCSVMICVAVETFTSSTPTERTAFSIFVAHAAQPMPMTRQRAVTASLADAVTLMPASLIVKGYISFVADMSSDAELIERVYDPPVALREKLRSKEHTSALQY